MRPDVIKSTYWGFASGFIRNDKTNLRILYFAADWSFFVLENAIVRVRKSLTFC